MSPRRQRLTTIVLMGVAGTGKTSVMTALVNRLGWPALEGDSLHPEANVVKMAAGVPLTDADREPWLDEIGAWIGRQERERSNAIATCSALRRRYRDRLRRGHPSVWFVHLSVPREEIEARLAHRTGHFMPPSLLDSQLATLEPLEPDEPGWPIDALPSPTEIADNIITALRLDPG
jgi:gluconokinase